MRIIKEIKFKKATTLESLYKGQEGIEDVIELIKQIAKDTKCNIAITGGAGTGKSTLVKAISTLIDEENVPFVLPSYVDKGLKGALEEHADASVWAISEVAMFEEFGILFDLAGFKRLIVGYHYPNPLRMVRQIEVAFEGAGLPRTSLTTDIAARLCEYVIKVAFCGDERIIESITEVTHEAGSDGYYCREIAYYDVHNKRYIVDRQQMIDSIQSRLSV